MHNNQVIFILSFTGYISLGISIVFYCNIAISEYIYRIYGIQTYSTDTKPRLKRIPGIDKMILVYTGQLSTKHHPTAWDLLKISYQDQIGIPGIWKILGSTT